MDVESPSSQSMVTPLHEVPLIVPKFFMSPCQHTRSPALSFRASSPVTFVGLSALFSFVHSRAVFVVWVLAIDLARTRHHRVKCVQMRKATAVPDDDGILSTHIGLGSLSSGNATGD